MKKIILITGLVFFALSCKKKDVTPEPTPEPIIEVNDLPTEFQYIKDIFGGEGVGAALNLTEDIVLIFNQAGDKYAWIEDDEIMATYALDDETGHLSDYAFSSVSAATTLETTIYFFDETGMNYTTATYSVADADEGWNNNNLLNFTSSTHELTEWGVDFSCPFNGVSAMWKYSDPGIACFGASEVGDRIWMANENGDEVVQYHGPNGGSWHQQDELENWTAQNNCNGPDGLVPMETLGAVYRIVRPNKIQEVMFNMAGDQFCFYNVSEGVFSQVYDVNY